ncbi:efflux RND transporter periplasmic adaptor subunit [Chitinilyticum piscinae]|uniref:Efflux RND transporter periplasmic adaptor subunit n=1 Tax=Chitinilyticum piscinae TaxID=2866724 RepID=A0A8J7FN99_9NEIS|nr:efflux RND transporter periplasmic adaptor subunit [Chitinilyticum piscinae]MBE9610590.1 efflux RND transporter periplasmic adaptor subunit [Chitinilyticum piscinae]
MKPFSSALIGASAILAVLLAGCGERTPQVVEEVRPVRLLTVAEASTPGEMMYSGVVRARQEVPLSFRIGGKLVSRKVEVGNSVQPGQVIALLDGRDVALQAQAAAAQVDAAQVQLSQAELDLKRSEDLLARKFVSQAEVDRRATQVNALKKQLEQARSQAQMASNQSGYAQLTTDVAGVVTRIETEPGAVVGAGQPVVILAQNGARDVVFDVPEGRQQQFKPGALVQVELWATEARLPATVREVSPAADPVARTYQVKVALPVGPQAPALGMSASVFVNDAKPLAVNGVALPLTALFGRGGEQRIWLLGKDGRVASRAVAVLAYRDNLVLVRGVKAGEQVVTAGVHLLQEGQKVSVLGASASGVASHVQ